MSVLDNWSDWKNFWVTVFTKPACGMENETVNDLAYQIGDYLANQVEAKNDQEKRLRIYGLSLQKKSSMRLPI